MCSQVKWHGILVFSISSEKGYCDILLNDRLIASRAVLGWLSRSLLGDFGCLSFIKIDRSLDIQEGSDEPPSSHNCFLNYPRDESFQWAFPGTSLTLQL